MNISPAGAYVGVPFTLEEITFVLKMVNTLNEFNEIIEAKSI